MFQPRAFKATVWTLSFALALALSACSWDRFYQRKYVVTTIPVGGDRAIVISTDEACEISCSIYYEVKVGDQIVAPMTRICSGDAESLTFKTVFAKDGNLVGAYEETRPDRLLLLHDFSNGITWPRQMPEYTMWDSDTKGRLLVHEFEKVYPGRDFTLEWGEACGVRRSP